VSFSGIWNPTSGIDEAKVRKRLREEFRIEIGGGLGPLSGKIWRVGLMGHTARPENVKRLLEALKICLFQLAHRRRESSLLLKSPSLDLYMRNFRRLSREESET
jgi:aspartate aminotransferase-like enzyme